MTVGKSGFSRQVKDFYPTPAWATEALLRHVPVAGKRVWEPAAGDHRMADVLRNAGADVLTSDIAVYGPDHRLIFDFLEDASVAPWSCDAIITNPPYGQGNMMAVRFCELALARCAGTVAMLLPVAFDSAKTRRFLFADNRRFEKKITLVDRLRFFDGSGSSDGTTDHAWFIWGSGVSWAPPVLAWEGKTR